MILKIITFIFVFAILFVVREIFMFVKALLSGEKNMTTWRLVGLGLAISYIITILATGFLI